MITINKLTDTPTGGQGAQDFDDTLSKELGEFRGKLQALDNRIVQLNSEIRRLTEVREKMRDGLANILREADEAGPPSPDPLWPERKME